MRINRYLALSLGISRRKADLVIRSNKVLLNGSVASLGDSVKPSDEITLNGSLLKLPSATTTIMLNKPPGYVCSRDGQGSKTIYELLPKHHKNLNPVGRLDKETSGLLLLTNDGDFGHKLTHPSFRKKKIYQVVLDKPLSTIDETAIKQGVELEDGRSSLELEGSKNKWQVAMAEGRNRQVRRTFAHLGYNVIELHRTQFGPHKLGNLSPGSFIEMQ